MNGGTKPFLQQLLDALTVHSIAEFMVKLGAIGGGAILHWAASQPTGHSDDCPVHQILLELQAAVDEGMTDPHQKAALVSRLNEREGFVIKDPGLIDLLSSAEAAERAPKPWGGTMLTRLEEANRRIGCRFDGKALELLAVALEGDK